MANNYPYENLSQPLMDLDPRPPASSAMKRKNTLKIILLVGLFIFLIGAAVSIAVVIRLRRIPKLSLISQDKEVYHIYKISPSSRYLAYVNNPRTVIVYNIESQSIWAEFQLCTYELDVLDIYFM